MPHVDLYSTGDFASIFYVTNSPFGNVSGFDPDKQTVIILHPLFLDTQWLENHWGDPRLYSNFNLIAFDMRCAGKSACRASGRHDPWVEAADLALCHLVRFLSLSPSTYLLDTDRGIHPLQEITATTLPCLGFGTHFCVLRPAFCYLVSQDQRPRKTVDPY